jgi:hypothetical protein
MIDAKTHASKNTLYFYSVVEIPRRWLQMMALVGLTNLAYVLL